MAFTSRITRVQKKNVYPLKSEDRSTTLKQCQKKSQQQSCADFWMCDHLVLSNMFIIAVLCGYLWVITFLKLHPTLRNQTEQNQKSIQAVRTVETT